MDFKGTVLITGAAGNLGRACVAKYVDLGYRVIATVIPGTTLGFEREGVAVYEADLEDESAVRALVQKLVTGFGGIDIALLLVGGFASGGIDTCTGADIRKMIALNFETAYYVARPVFQHMMERSAGRIVLVGARPALKASDGKKFLAYALSKSLVFQLADLLNAEGAAKNVITSVIVPSTIDTPANRSSMPSADFSKWVSPEDIAGIVAFATSGDAKAVRNPVYKIYGHS